MSRGAADSVPDALAALLAADVRHVAAALLVAGFPPGGKTLKRIRNLHTDLNRMSGLRPPGVLFRAGPDYTLVLECALLWEQGRLACRVAVGEAGTAIQLLRGGEAALRAGDPYAAVYEALASRPDR